MITHCAPFAALPGALDIEVGSAEEFAGSLPGEIKEDIKLLLFIRHNGRGFKLSCLVYLDMFCNDSEMLTEIYKELRWMGLVMSVEDETPAGLSLPNFTLLSGVQVRCAVADDGDIFSLLCDTIRTQAAGNGGVMGFDIE